jgi:hypothetical protein
MKVYRKKGACKGQSAKYFRFSPAGKVELRGIEVLESISRFVFPDEKKSSPASSREMNAPAC